MLKKPLEEVSLNAKRQDCHLQLSFLIALPGSAINGKCVKIFLFKLLKGILSVSSHAWEKQKVLEGDHINIYICVYI